jgi:hypothetical protein
MLEEAIERLADIACLPRLWVEPSGAYGRETERSLSCRTSDGWTDVLLDSDTGAPGELGLCGVDRGGVVTVVNPVGGTGGAGRDSWCTPEWLADVVSGEYEIDLDPCSNERSLILAKQAVTLKHDSTGIADPARPGTYRVDGAVRAAGTLARVFINPPYSRNAVAQWVRHYGHTDFIFLLRWAPDTTWFGELWPKCWGAWFPKKCEVNPSGRINFEAPPGVDTSSNPFPHALYLKSEPKGKFLDRLSATGYLVQNYGQASVRQDSVPDRADPASAGGAGGGGTRAGETARSEADRNRRWWSDEPPAAWECPYPSCECHARAAAARRNSAAPAVEGRPGADVRGVVRGGAERRDGDEVRAEVRPEEGPRPGAGAVPGREVSWRVVGPGDIYRFSWGAWGIPTD